MEEREKMSNLRLSINLIIVLVAFVMYLSSLMNYSAYGFLLILLLVISDIIIAMTYSQNSAN